MTATVEDHLNCVQMLLEAGAKLDLVNKDDHNVIHLAAKNNSPHALEVQRQLIVLSY